MTPSLVRFVESANSEQGYRPAESLLIPLSGQETGAISDNCEH